MANLQTGDIVLFSGNGLFSKIIRLGSGSIFSHVGLYSDSDVFGEVIYESTSLGKLQDVLTRDTISGVQITQFHERVATYDGEVFLLPIIGHRTAHQLKLFKDHMASCHGTPYEKHIRELTYAALDLLPWQDNDPDPSSLFCSEYAAYALRSANIMCGQPKPPNEYTPGDFNEDIELCEGYSFGELIQLK